MLYNIGTIKERLELFMAHEVEQIFYTSNEENGRFVPWHGLGTAVEQSPTSADAIKLAALDWRVESSPIFTDSGIEIPGYKANKRDSDGKVLGIVSDRYKVVQNSEAFDFTDSLIGEGCTYETAGSLKGGRKVFLLAKLPQKLILGDEVDPYVCFTNSHDGTGAIQACATPVRVVCNNTLNLALDTATRRWSTKHVGNIESKMEEARYTLKLMNDYMDSLSVTADKLAHTKVTEAEVVAILDDIFPEDDEFTERKKTNIKEVKNDIMVCMFAPDILKFKDTGWGVINGFADWVSHYKASRESDTFQERRFNKILDGHVVLDKAFEKLMLKVSA